MKSTTLSRFIKQALVPAAALSLVWTQGAGAGTLGLDQGFPDIQASFVSVNIGFTANDTVVMQVEGDVSNFKPDAATDIPMAPNTFMELVIDVPRGQSDAPDGLAVIDRLGRTDGADLVITGTFDNNGVTIGAPGEELFTVDLTTIAFGGASDIEDEVQISGSILGGTMVDLGLMGDAGDEIGLILAGVGYVDDNLARAFAELDGWATLTSLTGAVEPSRIFSGSNGTLNISNLNGGTTPPPPPGGVPVPAPVLLMGLGLLGMTAVRRLS